MRTDKLDYHLPPDRIATTPAEPRDASRLMLIRRRPGRAAHIEHHHVRDLPHLGVFAAGDLMVVNRTRVLPAYIQGTRVATGGRVSGLYLSSTSAGDWCLMLESRGTLQIGERIDLGGHATLTLTASLGQGKWQAALDSSIDATALLEKVGRTPLPPYIRKARRQHEVPDVSPADAQRYNTVYARDTGSVAAPTAGLHFTSELLAALEAVGVQRAEVTLNVGLGTFEPIRTDTLQAHRMHREHLCVPADTLAALRNARARGGRIVPIGTTTVRALESLPHPLPDRGDFITDTDLFIHPQANHAIRFTDALMTNFHLPRSTLLAMIASLPGVGLDELHRWYRVAIDQGYRFYSYGDAMLIT